MYSITINKLKNELRTISYKFKFTIHVDLQVQSHEINFELKKAS